MTMNDEMLLRQGERIDDLQCRGYKIIQNPEYFCFGMDAVLLANFARVKPNGKVIDLGTGTGIIPILMAAKEKGMHFTGLEIQEEIAEMAGRSVLLNSAGDKIDIICGDIKKVPHIFKASSFNAVTSNPPYIKNTNGLHNPKGTMNIARHEVLITLEEIIENAAYLLSEGGIFSMVHKPFRLPEIITLMKRFRLEPKRMQLVQPSADKEPNMVLIEGVKGGGPELKILPTLVIYEKDGSYTKQLLKYYGQET